MTHKAALNTAVRVVSSGVPGVLSYGLTEEQESVDAGYEVSIEVGRRKTSGWVVGKTSAEEALYEMAEKNRAKDERSKIQNLAASGAQLAFFSDNSYEHKPLELKPVLQAVPVFLPQQLKLFNWMSEYYGASLAEIIENAIPQRCSQRKVNCVLASAHLLDCLSQEADFLSSLKKRAPLQARVLEAIGVSSKPQAILKLEELGSGIRAAIQALEKKKLIEIAALPAADFAGAQTITDNPGAQLFSGVEPELLTPAQEKALSAIKEALSTREFSPFLLYGVTGSGKTEVYLRAVEAALKSGGGALVVVPEIALTPQLVDQFQARLKSPIAVLHSQVGASARWEAWESLLEGRVRVALGARSAVFAPVRDLSLIIVDEEHESSYKQSDGLRYSARDVAVMQAKLSQSVVVLGSATPSFESLLNAQTRRYKVLELPERATSRPLPQLEIVDLSKIKRKEMPSENISPQLAQAISETLEAKGQVIVLYNRRGFASYLQCESCNEVVSCPNCSVPLTLHKGANSLLCHYCDLSLIPTPRCAFCCDPQTTRVEHSAQPEKQGEIDSVGKLVRRGGGTEKVVDELQQLFPQACIIRMDRDAVDGKGAYRRILGAMRSGEADILVGTQMIAKGHDLPGVTLVGIISADVGLHLPDFRASEKAFQLITQAAGRCGRGKDPGRVFVQTREARHPTIVATVTGRFKAFARYELEFRQKLGYPPYGRLLRLVSSCPDRQEAMEGAQLVRGVLNELVGSLRKEEEAQGTNSSISVLGPAPAPHEKLCGRYRWHLLVKSSSAKVVSQLAAALYNWKSSPKQLKDFRLAIDVDPVDML